MRPPASPTAWGWPLPAAAWLLALLLPAATADAHPHLWYDIEMTVRVAPEVAFLDIRFWPNGLTLETMRSEGDANGDGALSAIEVAALSEQYREFWNGGRLFVHPSTQGDPLPWEVLSFALEAVRGTLTAHLEVAVETGDLPLGERVLRIELYEPSTAYSNPYTALTMRADRIAAQALSERVVITAVTVPARYAVALAMDVAPPPAVPEGAPQEADGETAQTAPTSWRDAPAFPTGDGTDGQPATTVQAVKVEGSWWSRLTSRVNDTVLQLQARVNLLMKELQQDFALGSLLLLAAFALVWGILHALGPGHGKGLAAAYLAQIDGRPADALKLGFLLAFTHTGSAIVLASAFWLLAKGLTSQKAFTDQAQFWAGTASGTLVVGLGIFMLVGRIRETRRKRRVDDIEEVDPDALAKRPGVAQLAIMAGIAPCPAAMAILLISMGANVFGIGVVLALALGLGIAIVVTGVGLLVVSGKAGAMALGGGDWRWRARLEAVLGWGGNIAVIGFGLLLAWFYLAPALRLYN